MSQRRAVCCHGTPLDYDCPDCAERDYAEQYLAWAYSADADPAPARPDVMPPPAIRSSWERKP